MASYSSDMLPTHIEYHSANLYDTYTMYNLADHPLGRLKQYNVIVLSTYLSHIWTEGPLCSQAFEP